ncbi:MBL fold metallo-hydrolase [Acinetobacter baumannii]
MGVLLSHNHYDHMDLATLEWLHKKFAMPIYTGLGNGFYLPKEFHVIEMDWWQEIPYHELRIVYTPAQHGSGRVYVTKIRHFGAVFRFWRKQDIVFLRVIPVMPATSNKFIRAMVRCVWLYFQSGAYEPRKLMSYVHMNPQDAVHAHLDLQAHRSVAIHYRTFQLTDEGREDPEHALAQPLKLHQSLLILFIAFEKGIN